MSCSGLAPRVGDAMLRTFRILAAAVAALTGCACTIPPPVLMAVEPDSGYPRQLLSIDGTTRFASIVWDAGSPSEQVIYNGLFGTSYFQIPASAVPGSSHPVAIRNSNGTSQTVQVEVLGNPDGSAPQFPKPRIEDVGLLLVDEGPPTNIALTVSAANLDANATVTVVEITGAGTSTPRTVSASVLWSGLPVDYLHAHQPDTFGYPVYHYAQLLSVIEGITFGSTLQVTVVNTDMTSDTFEYELPASVDMLDSDGDGLLNSWEEGGYPGTSGTVNLAGLGTKVWRKDVLVEVDWITDAKPDSQVWNHLMTAFSEAPVLNPDGSAGLNLIIDHGQGGWLNGGGETLADHTCLTFEPAPPGFPGCEVIESFYTYKGAHFDPNRLRLFHYAVLGRKHVNSSYSGEAERYGNDMMLTLLKNASAGLSVQKVLGTFLHELGHNLGLSHGNLVSDGQNYPLKVNLPSVMNYRYQAAGVDVDCDMQFDQIFTFSQGMLKPIDENSVDENIGLCDNKPVDFNPPSGVVKGPLNINWVPIPDSDFDNDSVDRWDDYDQWGAILLDFTAPDSKWKGD